MNKIKYKHLIKLTTNTNMKYLLNSCVTYISSENDNYTLNVILGSHAN